MEEARIQIIRPVSGRIVRVLGTSLRWGSGSVCWGVDQCVREQFKGGSMLWAAQYVGKQLSVVGSSSGFWVAAQCIEEQLSVVGSSSGCWVAAHCIEEQLSVVGSSSGCWVAARFLGKQFRVLVIRSVCWGAGLCWAASHILSVFGSS